MTSKNKVELSIKGNKNDTKIAGGTIGRSSSGNSEHEVKATIEGDENRQVIAGSDIDQITQVTLTLTELGKLLSAGLQEKNDQEDVQEIINDLKEQAVKPQAERNTSKIKRVLNNLASYIGLAGFAVSQAEQIKILYEHIIKFFS